MGVIVIPNVSEGRDGARVGRLKDAVERPGARVLDVHSDADHNRSVLTVAGRDPELVASMADLARSASEIDLTTHRGVHPRLGGLDVCPAVPHDAPMTSAVTVALAAARAIGDGAALPVYLYGAAAAAHTGAERSLPALRRGGLAGLRARAAEGMAPDFGPRDIDPARGIVCVGARDVLIAFNVFLSCPRPVAEDIARAVRAANGGPPGVRALGLALTTRGLSQVSMNLTRPEVVGIDDAFEAVATLADGAGAAVNATEIVGLVPERLLPDPSKPAARLLTRPGRSLESVLRAN